MAENTNVDALCLDAEGNPVEYRISDDGLSLEATGINRVGQRMDASMGFSDEHTTLENTLRLRPRLAKIIRESEEKRNSKGQFPNKRVKKLFTIPFTNGLALSMVRMTGMEWDEASVIFGHTKFIWTIGKMWSTFEIDRKPEDARRMWGVGGRHKAVSFSLIRWKSKQPQEG